MLLNNVVYNIWRNLETFQDLTNVNERCMF